MSSKRHAENLSLVDKDKEHSLEEAVQVLKSVRPAGFDESVELSIRLGIDPGAHNDGCNQVTTRCGSEYFEADEVR